MKPSYEDMSRISAVAFDLDGVVYEGNQCMAGAADTVAGLRRRGLRVFFVTNNSGKTRDEIAQKLRGMDIPADREEIFSSGYAAAELVRRMGNKTRTMVIGTSGLERIMEEEGRNLTRTLPCDCLVVGIDNKFSYEKICLGMEAVLGGAAFIACNRDANFPVENGRLMPGAGAMVAAVEAACRRKPHYVAGKPNTLLLEMVSQRSGLKPAEILMVGDGTDSDIVMANRFGSPSILISGGLISQDAREGESEGDVHAENRPGLVMKNIAEIMNLFEQAEQCGRLQ